MSDEWKLNATGKLLVGALLLMVLAFLVSNRLAVKEVSTDIREMKAELSQEVRAVKEGIDAVKDAIIDSPGRSFDVWTERAERMRREREKAAEDAKKAEAEKKEGE